MNNNPEASSSIGEYVWSDSSIELVRRLAKEALQSGLELAPSTFAEEDWINSFLPQIDETPKQA